MVLVQNWPIFNFSSLVNLGEENVSYDILNEQQQQKKKPYYAIKKKEVEQVKKLSFFQSPG